MTRNCLSLPKIFIPSSGFDSPHKGAEIIMAAKDGNSSIEILLNELNASETAMKDVKFCHLVAQSVKQWFAYTNCNSMFVLRVSRAFRIVIFYLWNIIKGKKNTNWLMESDYKFLQLVRVPCNYTWRNFRGTQIKILITDDDFLWLYFTTWMRRGYAHTHIALWRYKNFLMKHKYINKQ